MNIGIVGLPQSGKTTLFNALTRGTADVAAYAGAQRKPNLGVAKVRDERLDVLERVFEPKRTVPDEVTYLDLPTAPEGLGATAGITGEFLNQLQGTDALLAVTRAFDDPSVPHPGDGVDPVRDAEAVLYELAFADLDILSRRLERLQDASKGARGPERETLEKERSLLARLQTGLEAGISVRGQALTQDESRLVEGFQLLTAKPLIVVANIGEDRLSDTSSFEETLSSVATGPRVVTAVLCGKLEMELAQMEPSEEREFRDSMELGESGLDRMVRLSNDALDLVTFFTGNANDVRAWTITRGAPAISAAGKVHSDFERGFIRAEVVAFEDLARCGSVAEARRQGVLRQEGRTYVVSEGDVINILFNV